MLPLKADFVFCSFLYIVLLVDLSVFDSYCILKFNKASILGEGGGGDCADSLSPPPCLYFNVAGNQSGFAAGCSAHVYQ